MARRKEPGGILLMHERLGRLPRKELAAIRASFEKINRLLGLEESL